MIDRAEILRLANEFGLEARIVEKDYILGWVLAGIYRDPLLEGKWIFKGGICLKKCFFETYRFSEDLDFTVTDATQLDAGFLEGRFAELGDWLYETAGIELPADQRRFEIYNNQRGGRCGEGRIGYRGPIAPRGGDLPRIKLDLTADEILILPTVMRPVAHVYSDAPAEGITASCYAFEEVFGEKIRALGERSRPRDLYDVINLFRNGEFRAAAAVIRDVVRQKCDFKNIGFPGLEALAVFRDELVAEWGNMLGHQLPSLPPVECFWDALPEFFGWPKKTAICDLYRESVVSLGYELRGGNIWPPQSAITQLESELLSRGQEDREQLMKGFVRRFSIGRVRKLFRQPDRKLVRLYPLGVTLVGILDAFAVRAESHVETEKHVISEPNASFGKGCVSPEKGIEARPPQSSSRGQRFCMELVAPATRTWENTI